MRLLARTCCLLLHPFLSPLYGLCVYQWLDPRYLYSFWPVSHYIPLLILTCALPSAGWFIGKQLKHTLGFSLPSLEKLLSNLIFIFALVLVLYGQAAAAFSPEIYFYFIGLIIAFTTRIALQLTGTTIDSYLLASGALLGFLISLSLSFSIDLTLPIAVVILVTGVLGSFRLYLTKSGYAGIVTGWVTGVAAQLILLKFWM